MRQARYIFRRSADMRGKRRALARRSEISSGNFYPGIESGARLCGFVAITAEPLNISLRIMRIQMPTKIVAQDRKAWRSNANAFSAAVKAEMQGAAKFGVCAIETTTAQVRSSEVAECAGYARCIVCGLRRFVLSRVVRISGIERQRTCTLRHFASRLPIAVAAAQCSIDMVFAMISRYGRIFCSDRLPSVVPCVCVDGAYRTCAVMGYIAVLRRRVSSTGELLG